MVHKYFWEGNNRMAIIDFIIVQRFHEVHACMMLLITFSLSFLFCKMDRVEGIKKIHVLFSYVQSTHSFSLFQTCAAFGIQPLYDQQNHYTFCFPVLLANRYFVVYQLGRINTIRPVALNTSGISCYSSVLGLSRHISHNSLKKKVV